LWSLLAAVSLGAETSASASADTPYLAGAAKVSTAPPEFEQQADRAMFADRCPAYDQLDGPRPFLFEEPCEDVFPVAVPPR